MQSIDLSNLNTNYQAVYLDPAFLQNLELIGNGPVPTTGITGLQSQSVSPARSASASASPARSASPSASPARSASPSASPARSASASPSPPKKCDHKKNPKTCDKNGKPIKTCGEHPPAKPGFFGKIGGAIGLSKKPLP